MNLRLEQQLSEAISISIEKLYHFNLPADKVVLQKTRKEFSGDYTITVFPFLKNSGKSPELTAQDLGEFLKSNFPFVASFNVVKGFLNLSISLNEWLTFFNFCLSQDNYGIKNNDSNSRTVMVEYSSPNTNKPLHLGHVRNNLLGYAVANILEANGNKLIKANLVNDRGIHICKSMLAWIKFGNGETPETSGMKGDHLVGKYYVEFDKIFKREVQELIDTGSEKQEAEKNAPCMLEIQEMLRKWEAGDAEIIELWKTMNAWVYSGFDKTYQSLGVSFDKMYYESNTYLLGKNIIEEGLSKGVFFKKEDGSIWVDLTNEGLDQKVVLRADGTSVYITQDIGTAIERFREFPNLRQLIYTVGNEQDYHFKVLFHILNKLGYSWAKECFHLSYGMVELPEGKMKSREGTVVDADDLISEMLNTAQQTTQDLGKIEGLTDKEAADLFHLIGMGALKYFILKVDPKKKMLFDPKESIDFNGNTGPFIQYTHARIQSLLRKNVFDSSKLNSTLSPELLQPKEAELIKLIYEFPVVLEEAAKNYSPAVIANYSYELAKTFNQFYHEIPILREENTMVKEFRVLLSFKVGRMLKTTMNLLGIKVPDRM